jgi:hypothetical protein
MLIEFSSTLWPDPVTIDTDSKSSGDSGALLKLIKPQIDVRVAADMAPMISWAPAGRPGESPVGAFLLIAGVALVLTFAVVGIVSVAK